MKGYEVRKGQDYAWLKSCPTSEINFKMHLKTASIDEISELIADLPTQGNITKIKALNAELKRRRK